MYCVRCGAGLPEGAAFCPSCGASRGATAGTAAPPASGPPALEPGATSAPAWPVAAIRHSGFWRRLGGSMIDRFLLGSALLPVGALILVPIMGADSGSIAEGDVGAMLAAFSLVTLVVLLGCWLYYALLQSSPRQATLGQLALGMRVTDLQGRRITFSRASGRYAASLLTGFTFGIGYLMVLFTDRKQTLHDRMAGTLVVH